MNFSFDLSFSLAFIPFGVAGGLVWTERIPGYLHILCRRAVGRLAKHHYDLSSPIPLLLFLLLSCWLAFLLLRGGQHYIVSNQIPSGHGSYHAHPNGFSSITPSRRPLEVPLESTHYIILIIIIPIFHHPPPNAPSFGRKFDLCC